MKSKSIQGTCLPGEEFCPGSNWKENQDTLEERYLVLQGLQGLEGLEGLLGAWCKCSTIKC